MQRRHIVNCLLAALAVASGVVLWRQSISLTAEENEQALIRERVRSLAELKSDTDWLAAAQPGVAELEALRADRAALGRLRSELASVKAAVAAKPTVSSQHVAKPVVSGDTFASRERVPMAQWKNAGRKTALAAFETMLWAAAQGDVDALAESLVFDPRWQQQVQILWLNLPPEMREEHRSPERLFAALTAKDIPLGTAQVIHHSTVQAGQHDLPGPAHTQLVATLTDANKQSKRVGLLVRPADDGWRILIPGAAVAKYRERLQGK